MTKIFISTSSFGVEDESPLNLLKENSIDYELNPFKRKLSVEETMELLRNKDGVIAGTEIYNKEIFDSLPDLKIISRCGTGMDSLDMEYANIKKVMVMNTPSAHVDAVAELILGGILASLRRIRNADESVRRGEWVKPMGSLLKNKTVGIFGLGKVGKRLVELLQPFNVKIDAYDVFKDEKFAEKFQINYKEKNSILEDSDIIIITLPYEKGLYHFIGKNEFEKMKENILLVNTARGGLIDENFLYEFLMNNRKSYAYLDTFEEEPYKGKLKELSNILMTTHIGSYAREARIEMEYQAAENVCKFFNHNNSNVSLEP